MKNPESAGEDEEERAGAAEPIVAHAAEGPFRSADIKDTKDEPVAAVPIASVAEAPASFSTRAGNRLVRWAYWSFWFLLIPFAIAFVVVSALTPAPGVEPSGALAWFQSVVREQPVPVAIVVFTLFEMALWTARYHLPLARYAHPPLRSDLPPTMRAPFERARALLDEVDAIQAKNEKAILQDLTETERERLHERVEALESAMRATPFLEEPFVEALVKVDGEVDVRLSRWRKSEAREYIESILIAICVAMALRAFVIEAFKIPSGSMIPTLQVGDHIFVNKFIYGPAIPWTKSRLWTSMPPKRGDVMVFAFPEHPEQDFIKRVIALPGDTFEARNGHPILNGWTVPNCLVGTYSYEEADVAIPHKQGDLFVEYLGDEAFLTFYDNSPSSAAEYYGPFYAKPGEVWVMGDNRNNSHDSRMWFGGQGGGVPFANIRGRALFVWLSVSDAGFDFSRIGTQVMGMPRLPAAMKSLQPAMEKCFRDRPPLAQTTPPPPKPPPPTPHSN